MNNLTQAAQDVLNERERQKTVEGWMEAHDDVHGKGQLARAAGHYALFAHDAPLAAPPAWPWDVKWWKPKDPRRNLVRAAALILAEIERLDRASLVPNNGGKE